MGPLALAAWPWIAGAGAAAIPFLMRNPRIAQAIGGKLGKKVFTPGKPAVPRPGSHVEDIPGWPAGTRPRNLTEATGPGGFIGKHPYISSAGLGYAGTTAGSMMAGSPDQPTASPRGNVPLTVPGGVPGGPPVDDFTSNLPSYAERAASNRRKMFNNMSTILKHTMLLNFQNPGRKNNYMKNAIDLLKMGAMQQNEVELGNIIEEVFKDGKVPDSARVVYNRMIKAGASPKEAADTSGYTLEIEKSEAKIATDLLKAQPKAKDIYTKGMLAMRTLQNAYAMGNQEGAIQQLAVWLKTGEIEMPEQYAGMRDLSDADYYRLAAQILSGTGSEAVPSPTGEVTGVRVK
jgi:hypothetical protein